MNLNSGDNSNNSSVYRSTSHPISRGVAIQNSHQSNAFNSNAVTSDISGVKQDVSLSTTKAKASQSPSITVVGSTNKNIVAATRDAKVTAKDLPIPLHLLQDYYVLSDASKLDEVMRLLNTKFHGTLKAEKGVVKASLENGTEMRINSYRDVQTGKVVLEFIRLDGCSFTFQKAVTESKIILLPYMDISNVDEEKKSIEEELKNIESKMKFWYGSESLQMLPVA